MLPNEAGHLGVDYSIWLPDFLAGAYFRAQNGFLAVPWFNPGQCAGVPLQADPQGAYISLPQLLSFFLPPLRAIQASLFAYSGIGFLGMWWLARRRFACSQAGAVLAATLFALNGLFSARMMVGHLSFAPFMLLPAMACCAVAPFRSWRAACGAWLGFGILFAVTLEAGMAVLVLPVFLGLAMLMVLHALAAGGRLLRSFSILLLGTALGLALCAGKLAAVLSLMANVPRDTYPLPGFANAPMAVWMAIRCLFLFPSAAMDGALVNSAVTLEQHEFDYRVGPAPLLLLAWAAWLAWRRGGSAGDPRRRLLWEALLLCLVLPVALNTYFAPWTNLLKHVPVLRSASSLLRWFAAYIPIAAIAAGLCLDAVSSQHPKLRWAVLPAAVALTCAGLFLSDHRFYGAAGAGVYDPGPIQSAWRRLADSGHVEPITRVTVQSSLAGAPELAIGHRNLLAEGASPLFCYDALFGYRLEAFRQGTLHAGSILDVTAAGERQELNLKNPACYVFPAANRCSVGDTFLKAQHDAETAFASYRHWDFAKPRWANLADWIGIVTASATIAAATALGLAQRRPAA